LTLSFSAEVVGRLRIGAAHFGAGLFGCEHPFDASAGSVALLLPDGDFGGEPVAAFDAPIEALAGQDARMPIQQRPEQVWVTSRVAVSVEEEPFVSLQLLLLLT
jgi:hypothetical protein